MTDYAFILSKKYKGKRWVANGDTYEGITWLDESPKPTEKQLDKEYLEYRAANDYKNKRVAEYPSFAEQFDKLYHEGIDAWKAEISAIKARYPKPE